MNAARYMAASLLPFAGYPYKGTSGLRNLCGSAAGSGMTNARFGERMMTASKGSKGRSGGEDSVVGSTGRGDA